MRELKKNGEDKSYKDQEAADKIRLYNEIIEYCSKIGLVLSGYKVVDYKLINHLDHIVIPCNDDPKKVIKIRINGKQHSLGCYKSSIREEIKKYFYSLDGNKFSFPEMKKMVAQKYK